MYMYAKMGIRSLLGQPSRADGHERASKLVSLFHNLRLLNRMKKPDYTEPALGWNDEDFKVGLVKFGVAEYSAPAKVKIEAPLRPLAIPFEPDSEPAAPLALQAPLDEAEPLRLM